VPIAIAACRLPRVSYTPFSAVGLKCALPACSRPALRSVVGTPASPSKVLVLWRCCRWCGRPWASWDCQLFLCRGKRP